MGRQQYLSRLALGRSAFAELKDQSSVGSDQLASEHEAGTSLDHVYVQQYDSKGRPVNATTEARNTALRNAENAALALVGVVERKDNHDRVNELRFNAIRSVREEVLAAEHDAGETLDILVTLFSSLNYPLETLVRRIQAGLYKSSDSFTSVLQRGLQDMKNAGRAGSLAILFPGAPAAIVHGIARVLLGATLSQGVDYLSQWLTRQKLRKRTARRANRALYFACEAMLISLDLALLPLEYYAYAQWLGLAPTWPLIPSLRILLPTNPSSFHHFGWRSEFTMPVLHRLCAPAALVLLESSLWREQDDEIPVGSQLTRFVYPSPFNVTPWTISVPRPVRDPFGWLLYQSYTFRVRLLRLLGYTLEQDGQRTKFENDRIPPPTSPSAALHEIPDALSTADSDRGQSDGLQHIHRSTALAHLAPQYLANSIDVTFANLLLLPLQALVARSVTTSYLASPLPKTAFALDVASHVYRPFTSILRQSDGRWSDLASYLSKLGLSLSSHAAASTGMFFLVYKLARWDGRRNFDWGVRGRIGGLVYPTEGEE